MDTRRSFIKKAGVLSGMAGMMNALPASLQKVLAIDPAPGTSFYDAEHIVFLMQENRSFDHAFGSLQGVRGFNDPRAIQLPNGNPVWAQTNKTGETFLPFPLDIKESKITWMGSLPHGWADQVDARNKGYMNGWLDAKQPGDDKYKRMPLTMGYYSRKDIPFYYSLADAFTICDQHFCSSLTGTTPNRLYFWTGTIREKMSADVQANVWNSDADHGGGEVDWKTYPERLEDHGISWKVYQNEIYADIGLGDKQEWLDNFGDNPLEYFPRYHVRMSPEYIAHLPVQIAEKERKVSELEAKLKTAVSPEEKADAERQINSLHKRIDQLRKEQVVFTAENYEKLTDYQKSIYQKAFTTNRNDPNYHEISSLKLKENEPEMVIPKGDILHQFRKDVNSGKLPTVSWLAAPANFSDHPSFPWFGAWYISEVFDILTKNPEVWKKTIFILTYDENDGYFDHVPPFAPADPNRPNAGKSSAGIDTSVEYVVHNRQSSLQEEYNRESNIGLGFRVPMIVASPWSRGGYVCSEVYDHTSSLRFLEKFLEKKTGKKIIEENISEWRRTVCGDLGAVFRPYNGEKIDLPRPVDQEKFIRSIYAAKEKKLPAGFSNLTTDQLAAIKQGGRSLLPQQEKGVRNSCALPYELYVDAIRLSKDELQLKFEAANTVFGKDTAGAPFYVYAKGEMPSIRNYAIKAGASATDEWALSQFSNGRYELSAHGPNGFYRLFRGSVNDPLVAVRCRYQTGHISAKTLTGNIALQIKNDDSKRVLIHVTDKSYKNPKQTKTILPGESAVVIMPAVKSFGWYDIAVTIDGHSSFEQRFAGHVETKLPSKTDPLMGGLY